MGEAPRVQGGTLGGNPSVQPPGAIGWMARMDLEERTLDLELKLARIERAQRRLEWLVGLLGLGLVMVSVAELVAFFSG